MGSTCVHKNRVLDGHKIKDTAKDVHHESNRTYNTAWGIYNILGFCASTCCIRTY